PNPTPSGSESTRCPRSGSEHERPSGARFCRLRRATRAGWLLLIALVASVVGSLPAVALTLVLFRRANRFARARAPAAFGGKGRAAVSSRDEVRSMLL